ncbi:MAG: hypothetical protein LUB59_03460, partial [Candidatus Gastranaerophilales bacterium]|nr:hypothetical protein [Candidatus Gastranaerophilales bacterium]
VDYSGLDQVIITDTLQNLVYALGSMSIVTDTSLVLVPCEGTPEERVENKYFSVSVGTETDTDEQVLTITIWYPTDCMYTIIYDAMLNLPDYTSSSAVVDYSNTAFLNCDGKGNLLYHKLRDSFYLSDDWKVDNLQVEITKVDSGDGETTLEGAEFGLFSENGVLITKGITDSDGKVVFTTMRSAGILIRRNTAYYVQEITPPEGYVLDNTRHWFCFADNTIDVNLPEGVVATINKVDEGGAKAVIYFVIENMSGFALPGTGGIGTLIPTITGSLLFMVAGCFLLFNIVPQKTVKNGRKDKGG